MAIQQKLRSERRMSMLSQSLRNYYHTTSLTNTLKVLNLGAEVREYFINASNWRDLLFYLVFCLKKSSTVILKICKLWVHFSNVLEIQFLTIRPFSPAHNFNQHDFHGSYNNHIVPTKCSTKYTQS